MRPELRRQRLAALAIACTVLAGCAVTPPRSRGPAQDVAAIRQVVEDFRLALLRKDKPAYLRLFFAAEPAAIGWQAVVDDAALARIQRERPQAIKARPIPANNFVALIDGALAAPGVEEERIAHVEVDTDGETASAAFEYEYVSDGRVTNTGREYWQLVRTEQGWKIFSVIYTVRDPAR